MKSKLKYAIIVLFVVGIFFVTVWGQDYTTLIPVNEKDVHWGSVQAEIERITKSDPNSLVGNKVEKFGKINTKDANSLFPGWKFYGFEYSLYPKNPSDRNKVSLPHSLRQTLAVLSDSNPVKTFELYNGNSDDYGKFLKINKTSIRDVNDAKIVWGAFCEIYREGWKGYKIEKASDNEWKLGIYSYEQTIAVVNGVRTIVKRTNFNKVTTDPNTKQIAEWKNIVETSDKRLEKIPNDLFE